MKLKRRLLLKSITGLTLIPIFGCSDKGADSTASSVTSSTPVEPIVEKPADTPKEVVETTIENENPPAEKQTEPEVNAESPSGDSSTAGRVSEDDPSAVALNYVNDATTSEIRSSQDAICKTCQFYSGDGEWGPCTILSGKEVAAAGWCSAYVMKA